MTAISIIESLQSLGVQIEANGDRLKFDTPKGVITTEMKSQIVERKQEIIEMLAKSRPGDCTRPIPVRFNIETPPVTCLLDGCDGDLLPRGLLFECEVCSAWYSNAGALTIADQICLERKQPPIRFEDTRLPQAESRQVTIDFGE